MTTADTWFGIKEASAAFVSAILSTLTDYASGMKYMMNLGKVKVKQSRYRPGVAQRFPGS
jgi:hypothetical protein